MYVLLALYFISCVRDVFLVVYLARVCIGYHCCLMMLVIEILFFVLFLYAVVYMALLQVIRVIFWIV
ncbi:hypothetical protein Hanom_Chr09g00841311 [Helianthus anomalus]